MLEECEDLAEMIGIILGDGNIYVKEGHYRLRISFSIKAQPYVLYVKNLIEKLFNITPNYRERIRTNGSHANLVISRKKIILALISKGLMAGDKRKNQVFVPSWIKQEKTYIGACLRGLIDTDGTISPVTLFKTIIIQFSNSSIPLVNDFKEMCENLDIRTSKVIGPIKKKSSITGIISKQYFTSIQSKEQVKKFIEIIKPKKWDFNKESVLEKIGKTYKEAFSYVESPYNLIKAIEWKIMLEEIGSIKRLIKYLEKKGEFKPTEKSFKIWMEKLLTPKGYQQWLKYNTNLLISVNNNKILQFPQQLRLYLSGIILNISKIDKNSGLKEIIESLEVKINESMILKRLAFLINKKETRQIVSNYLSKLIILIIVMKKCIKNGEDINITFLKRQYELPFHRSHIKEIYQAILEKSSK